MSAKRTDYRWAVVPDDKKYHAFREGRKSATPSACGSVKGAVTPESYRHVPPARRCPLCFRVLYPDG